MKEKVFNLISQIANKPISEIEKHMNDQGLWDSFSHVELIISIETEFNIFFEESEIAELKTPYKVLQQVEKKVSKL